MTPRRLIEPARLAGTPLLRTQSDARLVDLVRAGHAAAFEAIVQRYRKPLLGYCSRLLPASRAEDAVQQTFLKAYQAMISGDAELKLRPWLYRIAHNCSLNLLRQNGWSHDELDENMDGVQRPDQALELRERLRATVQAVKALPERQRNAVLLREVDGLSYEEIALALGVGDGAVRQLLHRARATLRAGATALTPVGLVERLATAMAGTDPATRIAEVAAGVGAGAGVVKLSAAVLATGAIATGAITGPLSHHSGHARANKPAEDVAAAAATSSPGAAAIDDSITTVRRSHGKGPSHRGHGHRGHGHSGPGSGKHGGEHHGSSGRDAGGSDRSGPGAGEHHSGSGDRGGGSGDDSSGSGEQHSGSGTDGGGSDDRSGSGDGGTRDGSGDGGGSLSAPDSGDGGSSGDGGGSSGDGSGSGDGDTITTPTGTTGSSGSTDLSGRDGGGSGSGGDDGSSTG